MKIKVLSAMVLTALVMGTAPAYAVDPRQEHNIANCYFDKSNTGKTKERYCKALEGSTMTKIQRDCLLRAGLGSVAALAVGKINKKAAREIAVNVVAAGASGCISALIK
ncbi:hypothetical protein [Streptomyces sp. NBC_01565]|uniref:hypothetical protein n=1 Tax=unclassified Streptomyces TaxID=2593676 RepID=UPI00225230B9|nr:hypothetical protein [Streptomyces sp. NBC_01565]MCX4546283.1 hypothetical protein [Streptomyces sp. NBC_01565]